jgi:hypothetical protein
MCTPDHLASRHYRIYVYISGRSIEMKQALVSLLVRMHRTHHISLSLSLSLYIYIYIYIYDTHMGHHGARAPWYQMHKITQFFF